MLLGPAGVGKSCFKRGLMNLPFEKNTNSTILADVVTVNPRPLDRQWMKRVDVDGKDGWSQMTKEDEIRELASLIASTSGIPLLHSSPDTTLIPSEGRVISWPV